MVNGRLWCRLKAPGLGLREDDFKASDASSVNSEPLVSVSKICFSQLWREGSKYILLFW